MRKSFSVQREGRVVMAEPCVLQCGAEILVQCLIRQGVEVVFAYPGGTSMPIHQALSHVGDRVRTILPRHEEGGGFAALGYARSSGQLGVCIATSGPGATNLVACLANAQRDAVPLLAITGQVNTTVIGTDAFQEIPIVTVCRNITKHHFQVKRTEDLARVLHEAITIACADRPGPVIVDVPKNIQLKQIVPEYGPVSNSLGRADSQSDPLAYRGPTAWEGDDLLPCVALERLWHLLAAQQQLQETIVTTSAGRPSRWVAESLGGRRPRAWISGTGLGMVGFALPAAIGAQAAHPARQVIAIDTSDGFVSHVQELACAYCEKLPVKVLVLQPMMGDDPGAETFPDCAILARGFRAGSLSVTGSDRLDHALNELLDSRGPFVLDVHLPPRVQVLPALVESRPGVAVASV
jgi:thiamine pyrophosphate-dependent acetolactate synthase large subunit-like protein